MIGHVVGGADDLDDVRRRIEVEPRRGRGARRDLELDLPRLRVAAEALDLRRHEVRARDEARDLPGPGLIDRHLPRHHLHRVEAAVEEHDRQRSLREPPRQVVGARIRDGNVVEPQSHLVGMLDQGSHSRQR